MHFDLIKTDDKSAARAGILHTDHGDVETPIFMPVGTAGSVKGVHQHELKEDIEAQIILGNTYAGLVDTLRDEGFNVNQFEFLFEADLIGIKITTLSDIYPYRVNEYEERQFIVLCLTEAGHYFALHELGVYIPEFG